MLMPPVPVRVSRVNMVRLALMGLVVVDRLNGLGHLQGCGVQVWQRARVRVRGIYHCYCHYFAVICDVFSSVWRCFAVFRQTILCAKKPSRTRPHCCWVFQPPPLPSNRNHRSSGDCLEGKEENYQVCSVQYCVQQLCTVRCTHI